MPVGSTTLHLIVTVTSEWANEEVAASHETTMKASEFIIHTTRETAHIHMLCVPVNHSSRYIMAWSKTCAQVVFDNVDGVICKMFRAGAG